ncbi:MAG: thioredoxin, partial [Sphingomonas sp.]|nr:thioredoxin [Sphingomonas sp.]
VAISGRVINNTDRLQAIPPIRAELRDEASNKLVYQWTIAPPARSLAPGSAAGFSSTELDVPAGANMLSLRFAS